MRKIDPIRGVRCGHRSGIVLLVVMALLALFAVMGLTFVFYAESESLAARNRRTFETTDLNDISPERIFNHVLGQVIYDTEDTKSALFGLSLGRSIYGVPGGNTPYNGIGLDLASVTKLPLPTPLKDNINAPYTFPDMNNSWLGVIDGTGKITYRSFDRGGQAPPAPMRPTGLPSLTYPEADVKNVDGATGVSINGQTCQNDSYWIDPNFPIMQTKEGVRYKPLVALFMIDLDGRADLGLVANYNADYTKVPPGQYSNYQSGATPTNATSRYGIGSWEINPTYLLGPTQSASAPTAPTQVQMGTEIATMLRGSPQAGSVSVRSRYGISPTKDFPDGTLPANWFPTYNVANRTAWYYSFVPYNGVDAGFQYPRPGAGSYLSPIPSGLPNTWKDLSIGANHPFGFDTFNSAWPSGTSQDRHLAISNAEAILRYGEKGSPALTSDLLRFFQKSLVMPGQRNAINLVTPYSMAMDVPHLAPIGGNSAATYSVPTGTDIPVTTTNSASPSGGDFSSHFLQSKLASSLFTSNPQTISLVGQLNMGNQPMPDYRYNLAAQMAAPQGTGTVHYNTPAGRIYKLLLDITGVQPGAAGSHELAQLAANFVDYQDNDNNMTVFNWTGSQNKPGGAGTAASSSKDSDFVFGVEQPRLLINEFYASIDNDSNDPNITSTGSPSASYYVVNLFVELINPQMGQNAAGANGGTVELTKNGYNVYRLIGVWRTPTPGSPTTPGIDGITTNPNSRGTPAAADAPNPDPNKDTIYPGAGNHWKSRILAPNNSTPSPTGFLLVGPPNFDRKGAPNAFLNPSLTKMGNIPDRTPKFRPQQTVDEWSQAPTPPNPPAPKYTMQLQIDKSLLPADPDPKNKGKFKTPADINKYIPAVILQRLANPNLPPQPDPTKDPKTSPYNPYVTVDYFDNLYLNGTLNNSIEYVESNPAEPAPQNLNTFHSDGRRHPMWATFVPPSSSATTTTNPQGPNPNPQTFLPAGGGNQTPKTTFKSHNGDFTRGQPDTTNLYLPFEWYQHLDRPFINRGEMLDVTFASPVNLTHRFPKHGTLYDAVTNTNPSTGAARAGGNSSAALMRLFEVTQVPSFLYNPNVSPHFDPSVASPSTVTKTNFSPQDPNVYMTPAVRVPGKININTVWDQKIIEALLDPQMDPSARFHLKEANDIYNKLNAYRTSTGPIAGFNSFKYSSGSVQYNKGLIDVLTQAGLFQQVASTPITPVQISPSPNGARLTGTTVTITTSSDHHLQNGQQVFIQDVGFPGYDGGYYSINVTNKTTFTYQIASTTPPAAFPPSGGGNVFTMKKHDKHEILRKMLNNITFTSNVFAVWATVGFFEVDQNGKIVGEMGKTENRQIRHRMFAIIDRSQLVMPSSNLQLTDPNGSPVSVKNATKQAVDNPWTGTQAWKSKYVISLSPQAGTTNTFPFAGQFTPQGSSIPFKVAWQFSDGQIIQIGTGASAQLGRIGLPVADIAQGKVGPGVGKFYFYSDSNQQPTGNITFQPGLAYQQMVKGATSGTNLSFGYPGPQPNFNLGDYGYVVPYWSVID
jgi:hypothetical protein